MSEESVEKADVSFENQSTLKEYHASFVAQSCDQEVTIHVGADLNDRECNIFRQLWLISLFIQSTHSLLQFFFSFWSVSLANFYCDTRSDYRTHISPSLLTVQLEFPQNLSSSTVQKELRAILKKTMKRNSEVSSQTRKRRNFDSCIAKCSAKLRKLQFIAGVESEREVCYIETA